VILPSHGIWVTINGMIHNNQAGAVNGVVVSLVLAVLLLIGALSFGGWAFNSRQDFKNHTDTKVNAAVAVAKDQQSKADAIKYAEAAKLPLRPYNGPEAYGSLVVNYPKTWSAYVDDSGRGQALVDGYFNPATVPSISDPNSHFALRVQVINQPYAQVLQNFTNLQQGSQHPVSFSAYALPLQPKVVGIKAVGQINQQTNGTMVVLPLRSNTLEISTEGNQFLSDFNNYILPQFNFSP
jgi:hypothetical protein